MSDLLKNLEFELTYLIQSIKDFIKMLHEDVWNNELIGLIKYLFSCIPLEIRLFMIFTVVLVIILGIWAIIRRD